MYFHAFYCHKQYVQVLTDKNSNLLFLLLKSIGNKMITHESSLENITEQFAYILENYSEHGFNADALDHIVIGGLGGSGIGATIAKCWFYDKVDKPIEVVNDYNLPKFINQKTLVILNSYSGNTEETLSMYRDAKAAGSQILIITSGGKLEEIAQTDNIKMYKLPKGYQPRMTIGLGLGLLLMMVGECFKIDYKEELEFIKNDFPAQQEKQINSATQIFNYFKNTLKHKFVILADRELTPVAIRFAQQLNENSKLEAFVNTIPEANHNVLESYNDKLPTNFIMLHTENNDRVGARFDFLGSHLELENNKVLPLVIPEFTIYSIFDVIYRLDWVSVMFANELGARLMEVPNIMNLKEFLSALEVIESDED